MVFAVALGNHDWRGSPQAEIDFSHNDSRWNMPAEFFSFRRVFADTCVDFIMTDTSPFAYNFSNPVVLQRMPTFVRYCTFAHDASFTLIVLQAA